MSRPRSGRLLLIVLLAACVSACDVEVSLGDHDASIVDGAQRDAAAMIDAAHDDAASIDGDTIDAATSDANELDAGAPDAHADDAHVADAGVDAPGHDAGPPDVGADAPPTCAMPDAGACVQCQAALCCSEYAACAGAASCPCIVDCLLVGGHTAAECAVHCGADHGESTPLIACAQHHCGCP